MRGLIDTSCRAYWRSDYAPSLLRLQPLLSIPKIGAFAVSISLLRSSATSSFLRQQTSELCILWLCCRDTCTCETLAGGCIIQRRSFLTYRVLSLKLKVTKRFGTTRSGKEIAPISSFGSQSTVPATEAKGGANMRGPYQGPGCLIRSRYSVMSCKPRHSHSNISAFKKCLPAPGRHK